MPDAFRPFACAPSSVVLLYTSADTRPGDDPDAAAQQPGPYGQFVVLADPGPCRFASPRVDLYRDGGLVMSATAAWDTRRARWVAALYQGDAVTRVGEYVASVEGAASRRIRLVTQASGRLPTRRSGGAAAVAAGVGVAVAVGAVALLAVRASNRGG